MFLLIAGGSALWSGHRGTSSTSVNFSSKMKVQSNTSAAALTGAMRSQAVGIEGGQAQTQQIQTNSREDLTDIQSNNTGPVSFGTTAVIQGFKIKRQQTA